MSRNLQIANKTYVRNENRVGNGNIVNIRIMRIFHRMLKNCCSIYKTHTYVNERNARFLLNLRGFTVTFTQISGNVQTRKGTLKTHF